MSGWGVLITLLILFGVFAFFRLNFHRFTSIEDRFFENLNAKENQARKQNPVSSSVRENLAIYDIHPESFTLQAESVYAGMHLADIPIRMESGANIVKIQRGKKSILIPDGKERIFPGDELVAVGTREQLGKFVQLMNTVALNEEDTKANFSLSSFVLDENSYLTGKSLREANLRAANCMVICVLRNEEMITNPSPDWTFTSEDAVWLAGESESVNWFTGTK
jgi:CPA2 family monovalent cation:H+ antiporter-2